MSRGEENLLASIMTLTFGALASGAVSCTSRRLLTKKRAVPMIVFPTPLPLQKIGSLYQVQKVKLQYIKRTSYLLKSLLLSLAAHTDPHFVEVYIISTVRFLYHTKSRKVLYRKKRAEREDGSHGQFRTHQA
jgi:hypothetical protein